MEAQWSYEKKIREVEETLEDGKSIKSCIKRQQIGQSKLIAMKDRIGMVVHGKELVLKVIKDFYCELYTSENYLKER